MVRTFPTPVRIRRHIGIATAVLMLALTLGGCASVPPPNDLMNQAQMQLRAARDAGAADYAPVDLGFAQDKFQQAQMAISDRKYAQAADLADESQADAELASSKARLGAARAQIQSKIKENDRLRSQGEQAAAEFASKQQQEQQEAQPAASASSSAPPPTEDMPAPSSSAVSTPAASGFQTMPDNSQPSNNTQGGQP